jgi:hypothetical protein
VGVDVESDVGVVDNRHKHPVGHTETGCKGCSVVVQQH